MLRITTWNVNGLRSLLKKDGWKWVQDFQPDVLCLQEIRVKPNQIGEKHQNLFSKHEVYWNPGERPGYSGVLTMTLRRSELYQLGLGIPEFDKEGRLIATRHRDILLFNVYFPSGQRGHERVAFKLDFYSELLKELSKLSALGEKIVIAGDFNTAHKEIDLRNPKSNQKTSGFLPEEREWIDRYMENGFADAFRELYPKREQYTWWTYRFNARQRNIGWRLDYFLVSEELIPRVEDVIIHDEVIGSDHCPVTLVLDMDY